MLLKYSHGLICRLQSWPLNGPFFTICQESVNCLGTPLKAWRWAMTCTGQLHWTNPWKMNLGMLYKHSFWINWHPSFSRFASFIFTSRSLALNLWVRNLSAFLIFPSGQHLFWEFWCDICGPIPGIWRLQLLGCFGRRLLSVFRHDPNLGVRTFRVHHSTCVLHLLTVVEPILQLSFKSTVFEKPREVITKCRYQFDHDLERETQHRTYHILFVSSPFRLLWYLSYDLIKKKYNRT